MRFQTVLHAMEAACDLHNLPGCLSCNKVESECDYGSCVRRATVTAVVRSSDGRVVELRPACARDGAIIKRLNGAAWPTELVSAVTKSALGAAFAAADRILGVSDAS